MVFGESGRRDLVNPKERGESVGIGTAGAYILGTVEIVASIMILLGIFTQLGALALIIVMLGAIQKKVFIWKTGFWGDKSYGWHYDLTYLAINLLILFTGGGKMVLL